MSHDHPTRAQLADDLKTAQGTIDVLRRRLADQDAELAAGLASVTHAAEVLAREEDRARRLADCEEGLCVAQDDARIARERHEAEFRWRICLEARVEDLVGRLAESERRRLEAERRADGAGLRPVGLLGWIFG